MNFHFLGGAGEVGRNAVLVESGDLRLLFDCGIKAVTPYEFPLLKEAKRPHAVALSHAHLDHSGYLPAFLQHASVPVISTFPTFPLVQLLLEDTQKIAEQERRTPYFSSADLRKLQKHSRALPYHQEHLFHDGSSLKLLDAGHILGSAQVFYETKEGNVLYTGDLNTTSTQLHAPAEACKENVDVLVTESTYGNSEHPNRQQLEKKFGYAIEEALADDFAVLIPAFALGRTQEILCVLQAHGLSNNLFVDGMSVKASDIVLNFPSYLKDAQKFAEAFSRAHKVESAAERKGACKPGHVILATAGMLEGGPSMSYIQQFLKRGIKAKIFLTGFQVRGTKGRRLLEEGIIRLNGKTEKWPWEVRFFDFSAHADQKGLLRHAKKANPEKIFCVHGDPEQLKTLVHLFREEGFDAYAPQNGDKITV